MRLWPRSLISQLLILFLTVLIFSQAVILVIFIFDRQDLIYRARWRSLSQRISSIVQVFKVLPEDKYENFMDAISTPGMRVRFVSRDQVFEADVTPAEGWPANRLFNAINRQLGDEYPIKVKQLLGDNPPPPDWVVEKQKRNFHHHRQDGDRRLPENDRDLRRRPQPVQFIVQLQLENGKWLEFYSTLNEQSAEQWPVKLLLSTAFALLFAGIIAAFLIWRLVKPLKQLGTAAEAFGKNISTHAVEEKGPLEIRQTARAFNTMQKRLERYLSDRTSVLSAISHDLKTPVTRMRLRSEMLEDINLKDKYCHDLDEMTIMINETLEFMRGEMSDEQIVSIDINALLETLQADREEFGQVFILSGKAHSPLQGRSLAIKRCISNLLDNAFRFSDKVSVCVEDSLDRLVITIADNGPGIPPEKLEDVFEPFRQLDKSRSKSQGGSGLGLGIARNIARGHGGDLKLSNDNGLVARITLPR